MLLDRLILLVLAVAGLVMGYWVNALETRIRQLEAQLRIDPHLQRQDDQSAAQRSGSTQYAPHVDKPE